MENVVDNRTPPPPDVIWMRPDRSRRPLQVALSREQITSAALTIADTEGVATVTMRRIAQELGCGTMSLYRHVRTKDEVLDLIVDAALGEEERPDTPSGDWRADLYRLARAKRTVLLRHPWLSHVVAGRPVLGPNAIASTEYALSALAGLGLSMDETVRIINTLHAFVNGFVQTEIEESKWRRHPESEASEAREDDWREATLPYLQHVIESGRYPHFTRMVYEAESSPDTDASFEWQLERVIDGLSPAVPS
ncbi:TetR/AcrR family transcriptional regulator [Halostreptopolyspora alba]